MRSLDSLYVGACRTAGKFKMFRCARWASDELRDNLELAGLEVQPDEVAALALLALASGASLALTAAAMVLLVGLPLPFLAPLALAPPLAFALVGWYPSWRAERERVRGLGEAPMLVGYMSMSMKVVPNLERSACFAAEHIGGPLGQSLKDFLWRSCLRAHVSVDGALERFGQRWGRWCEGLKRSIHLIRSSASERTEASRLQVLDRALEVSLQDTYERMQGFAAGLHLPTLMIYSIGVLLPLAAFPPPEVAVETNRPRAGLLALVLGAVPPAISFLCGAPSDIRALACLWGVTAGVATYLHRTYRRAYETRSAIERMEREFCDSLVQLGNRIAEGRPAEDAFEHVANAMRGSEVADLYSRVSINIRFGGMGLRAALFDLEGGALRGANSRTIRSALRMLVDIIERSTSAAGAATLRMADHLKELKRVELDIRRSLGEVVTSMRSSRSSSPRSSPR
ncbi:MAG: hypothetical protein QMC89_05900 [Candidatus Hodarchaeaceae archaeon]|nr:hypothetical protein [Candidatus Hodarchaeaceae archaeon]